MKFSTSSFLDGGSIALLHADLPAGGQNLRPDLKWSDLPPQTKSLAISIYDPDAPTGSGFWHWIATDIPKTLTELPSKAPLPAPSRQWANDNGINSYSGPCPPPNRVHRYIFTLHALGVEKLALADQATSAQVRMNIFANQLDAVSFTGKFQLPNN